MARRLAGLGMVYATVVSALLFGAFHLGAQQFQSPSSVAILVLFGLVYAPVFLITRSVYVTCAIHAAWNIFVSLSAVQPNSSLGYLSYGGLAVVLAIDLLLAIFELMRAQKRAALSEAPQEAVLEPEAFARGMDIVEGPAITSEVNSTEVVQREEGGRRARFPIGLLGFASCLTGIISWAYVLLAMNPRGPAGLALGLFATVMLLLGLGLAVVFAVTFAIRSS
jgi:membrane protease YdiL (CAAX protease family)